MDILVNYIVKVCGSFLNTTFHMFERIYYIALHDTNFKGIMLRKENIFEEIRYLRKTPR